MPETAAVTISVLGIHPIAAAGRLHGLADVALVIDGVEVVIHGVQILADAGKTEIRLPKYRAPNGEWMAAISLPPETRGAVGDVVIAAALEAGLLREREAVV